MLEITGRYLWLILASGLVVIYLLICFTLYRAQTDLIYPRKNAEGKELANSDALAEARAAGVQPYYNSAGVLLGYVPPNFKTATTRGTALVFHGSGACAFQRTAYVEALASRGFRVFLFEYPGYGGRDGIPSEAAIVPEAQQLVRDLAGLGPVYLWGESLGTGVAGAVAADPQLPVQGLVLITPFDSLVHEAWSLYPFIPVRLLLHDHYDSYNNLAHFAHPIFVMRSGQDEIIPAALTLRLFEHLPVPKKIILNAESGHANWPSQPTAAWWDEAVEFITSSPVSTNAAPAIAPILGR